MPALVTLDGLSLAAPDGRPLFSDLTLSLDRQRVGLVGRNGAGKSTLLRALCGAVRPLAGSISVQGSIGLLRQSGAPAFGSAADALDVGPALACLRRIERGDGDEADFAAADWLLPGRIEAALAEVGLDAIDLDRPLAGFSGGERMRLDLARLLIAAPDLLLMDEPTNNLDRDGRTAVATMLAAWRGGVMIASHDRALLEAVDHIVELSPVGVRHVGGGWSAFVAARDAERVRAAEAVDRAEAEARAAGREAQDARERQARRDSGGRAFAASGSAPRIALGLAKRRAEATAGRTERLAGRRKAAAAEVLADARAHVERVTPLSIVLPPTALHAGRRLVSLEDVVLERGGRRLFGPLSLDLTGPERLSIEGPNGAGKSSLMRLLAGTLEPDGGTVHRACAAAFLDQHVTLLDDQVPLLETLRRLHPALTANQAFATLARFAFRNRDALRPAGALSGGERLRAGLACVMAADPPPPLLLLDEPTNHLDIDSVEELERALAAFDGALVVISHDRRFLEAIGTTRSIRLGDEERGGSAER